MEDFWPILLAPFIGSLVSVVAIRVHAPLSILWGRSECRRCRHALGPRDLVPLFSWIALRGRCRYCGGAIDASYPMVELAAIGIAVWSSALMSGWWLWASCLFGWTLLALAAADLRHQLLPDFLTIPLLVAGLGMSAALAPQEFVPRLVGAGIGFGFIVLVRGIYWLLRRREGIGLGDAKLFAATGAWVSWDGLACTLLIASATALACVLLRRPPVDISLSDRVPFGAFLCLGAWIVWLYGPLS